MKLCFGYVRVSTAKQGEGVSLEAQRDAILAYAARSNIEIVEWFAEKETAAKSGRPIFSAMIKALRRGKADGLVMHKIDRSARNFGDWAKIGELSDDGIDVHFATETLDFRSRGGRLSADIQAVIAADYIRNLREETIKGLNGRLKQGIYPFRAPIGYLDNGGGKPKTPDPLRAPLVVQTFELYASGEYSTRSLRDEMERRGLRNAFGMPVSKCGLETILGNSFYCGLISIRRTGCTYEGVHEAIISPALFETVQAIKRGKTVKKCTRHHYLYRGLFACGHCGRAMIPERQKGHVYYRCQTRDCQTKCVREDLLSDSIIETLRTHALSEVDSELLTQELELWFKRRESENPGNAIKLQLANAEQRIYRLTDALIDRLIDQDAFNVRNKRLLFEKAKLTDDLAKIRSQANDRDNVAKFLELTKSLCALYIFASFDEKREIVKTATSNRVVREKYVSVEPSNWLVSVNDIVAGLSGAPDRPNSRSTPELQNEQFKKLVEAAKAHSDFELQRPPSKLRLNQTNQNASRFGKGSPPCQ